MEIINSSIFASAAWVSELQDWLRGRKSGKLTAKFDERLFPQPDRLVAALTNIFVNHFTDETIIAEYAAGVKVARKAEAVETESVLDYCVSQKCVLHISKLESMIPFAGEIASLLTGVSADSIRVSAFVSGPDTADATPPHYDYDDSFVVQAVGRKNWRLFESLTPPSFSLAGYELPADSIGPCYLDSTVQFGEIIYIAKGAIHKAATLGECSIHLAVAMTPSETGPILGHAIFESLFGSAAPKGFMRRIENLKEIAGNVASASQWDGLQEKLNEHRTRVILQQGAKYFRAGVKVLNVDQFSISPGALFSLSEDGNSAVISYTDGCLTGVQQVELFVPPQILLPKSILPAILSIARANRPFGAELLSPWLDPRSCEVLLSTMAQAGIVCPYPYVAEISVPL